MSFRGLPLTASPFDFQLWGFLAPVFDMMDFLKKKKKKKRKEKKYDEEENKGHSPDACACRFILMPVWCGDFWFVYSFPFSSSERNVLDVIVPYDEPDVCLIRLDRIEVRCGRNHTCYAYSKLN